LLSFETSIIEMPQALNNEFERKSTDRLRRAIELSWECAAQSTSDCLDTRHLLMGLFAKENGIGYVVLENFGVTYPRLESLCVELNGAGLNQPAREMKIADEVQTALNAAVDSARSMGHNYYGTEHLLIGLCTEGLQSVRILGCLGLDPHDVRNEVRALLGHF
jgi:ATP-dependent Clp protease ATP-binding subunit ClpC